jgi:hypothetical protein
MASHNESVSLSDSTEEPNIKRKRRKLSHVWELFAAVLSEETVYPTLIVPWLQLFSTLIKKYPNLLPPLVLLEFVRSVSGLMERAKDQISIEFWCIQIFTELAFAASYVSVFKDELPEDEPTTAAPTIDESTKKNAIPKKMLTDTWVSIWPLINKKLAYPHPHIIEKAPLLLKTLLEYDLVDPQYVLANQDSLWKLPIFQDSTRWNRYE